MEHKKPSSKKELEKELKDAIKALHDLRKEMSRDLEAMRKRSEAPI